MVDMSSAIILGNKNAIQICYYSSPESIDDEKENFIRIVDSFQFEEGYEYRRAKVDLMFALTPYILAAIVALIVLFANLMTGIIKYFVNKRKDETASLQPICQNCENIIEENEQNFAHIGHTVCRECYQSLNPNEEMADYEREAKKLKRKSLAVLLAVLFGPFGWIYIYKKNRWKFWLDVSLTILMLPVWWAAAWAWPIVDISMKPKSYFERY